MVLLPFAILLLLYIPFICALPSLPLNDTSTPALDVSNFPSSCNTRTLWDIILSCVATLFACTWTAIHPNIPGMEEKKSAVLSRRLFIMMMALIIPELMITWATMQSRSAHWTVTHGFFAWMGGFILYVNNEPRATLKPYELLSFVREGCVDVPVIAEADIEDRSKGDALSKGIAVLQLAWFFIQLIARYAQNLPMTLLEIDTSAVASLTSIAYSFWWKKPKDVGRPYAVHWKPTAPPSDLAYEYKDWSYHYYRLVYAFMSLMGMWAAISPRDVRERRVPSLGGYDHHHLPNRNHIITLFIGCFSGMVFGGMHCLGWNGLFQGHAEQILWRTASLVIVSTPVFVLLSFGLLILSRSPSWRGGRDVATLAIVTGAVIYIFARVTLLVLMLLSFQSLPSGVYDTVVWTKFIPHL
ncbi:hypothetical protein EDB19DRAFT_1850920 [Suillus lakei]|nr:hypothetical protein EDB19DRAFT_1850920 [Suillus lakei]